MRNIKINRRLLKTAAAIDILAFVIFFYARTKKNYYEYVYPLINEIRIKSKDIAMEGPGEFNK